MNDRGRALQSAPSVVIWCVSSFINAPSALMGTDVKKVAKGTEQQKYTPPSKRTAAQRKRRGGGGGGVRVEVDGTLRVIRAPPNEEWRGRFRVDYPFPRGQGAPAWRCCQDRTSFVGLGRATGGGFSARRCGGSRGPKRTQEDPRGCLRVEVEWSGRGVWGVASLRPPDPPQSIQAFKPSNPSHASCPCPCHPPSRDAKMKEVGGASARWGWRESGRVGGRVGGGGGGPGSTAKQHR